MRKQVKSLLDRLYGRFGNSAEASMGNLADFAAIALSPIAAGAVTGATGALTAGPFGQVVVARTGAGVYTLTLSAAAQVGAANCICMITLRTSGTSNYVHTSATVKTVNTFAVDGTTATDKNFDFVIYSLV
jgi:hypothetical protein